MSTLAPETVLRVTSLSAYYGELRAVYDCSLELARGDVLAVIGANGAGKSSLLKAIVGLMRHGARSHARGTVEFEGRRLDRLGPEAIVEAGVALVPEGRRLFARMSVEDNLLAGAYLPRCRSAAAQRLADVFDLFPRLRERRRQVVSEMSGGEQQMVAVARAMICAPRLLLLDEPSLGLAPKIVDELLAIARRIADAGTTVLMVEQNVRKALAVADRGYVIERGALVASGPARLLERCSVVREAYLGKNATQIHTAADANPLRRSAAAKPA